MGMFRSGSEAPHITPVKDLDDLNPNSAAREVGVDPARPKAVSPDTPAPDVKTKTETEAATSSIIEKACSELANILLGMIHDSPENCVSSALSTAVNNKLEERRKQQQQTQSATYKKGVCKAGVSDSIVEWSLQGAANATGIDNNSIFQTECTSCSDCIAKYADVKLNIKFNDSPAASVSPSSSGTALHVPSTISSTSSSNSFYSTLNRDNNSMFLTMTFLILILTYALNFKKH